MRRAIVAQSRLLHVILVFITGDRTATEASVLDGLEQGFLPARFDTRFYEIPHNPLLIAGRHKPQRETSACLSTRNWCRRKACSAISLSSMLKPITDLPCMAGMKEYR